MDNNETNRPVCSCCGATIETDDYYAVSYTHLTLPTT